ncbi:MAG: hypothetical protein JO025_09125 [Verrucomicrobia bacterium]|nr:hypothetical protein [Verrucomicrobiota bacterium]
MPKLREAHIVPTADGDNEVDCRRVVLEKPGAGVAGVSVRLTRPAAKQKLTIA